MRGVPPGDRAPDGRLARLAPATEINLRARLAISGIACARLSDNLANAIGLPQPGLPLPGRTVRIGLFVGG